MDDPGELKFKLVETASFIVTDHNDERSVALGLPNGRIGAIAGVHTFGDYLR